MDGDVRLTSISYKYDGNFNGDFTSFQCTLSNGDASPFYESEDCYHSQTWTVNLDPDQRVAQVQMGSANGHADWLRVMNLIGDDGAILHAMHGPMNTGLAPFITHDIAENEELVGIYGVYNQA